MDQESIRAPWRLAIRSEGEYVNAYFAPLDSMDGAILLGSLKRNLAQLGMFEPWRLLMQEAMNKVTQETLGVPSEWNDPEPAPEHERSGRA